jgi:hypothetical protein
MKQLFASGYVREPKGRADLIEVTELGRDAFSRMIEGQDVPADIGEFLLPKKQGTFARIFGGLTSR